MSIVSVPFLFLFFPLSLIIYYLIPQKKSTLPRNIFLLLISIFFYAWAEPVKILLLCALILITWLLGNAVCGRKGTKTGKWIVFAAVAVNVGVLFVYKYLDFTLENVGILIGRELPSLGFSLPLGLSFFAFQSISYVVDIYRGKTKPAGNLLNAALYLCIFFKMTQGPITQYNQFEPQLYSRSCSWGNFCEGLFRFVIGLGKKIIISSNVSFIASTVFAADPSTLDVTSSWLACFAYMIQIFFDFSGYSDMALGLAKMFGFDIPENFNYPYMASSVTEYWQRWHMTLGTWFRDYMFYPLTLGPAIRMRKFLAKKKVSKDRAKLIQNIFVIGCIWFTTGIWHGAKWNYIVWGFINGAFVLWELYKKPLKNEKLNYFTGWLYTILVIVFTKALVCTKDMHTAITYYGAMFGLNSNPFTSAAFSMYIKECWVYLLIGVLFSFPIYGKLKEKLLRTENKAVCTAVSVIEVIFLLFVFVISVAFVFRNGFASFIYQKF